MRPELTVQRTATAIDGPLLFLRRNVEVGLNEAVEILSGGNPPKPGRVAAIDRESMVIEVLESTIGLGLQDIRVRFHGEPLHFAVGPGLLGRVFNGVGQPADGGPPVPARKRMRIDGVPINPTLRALPKDFIESGVTAIDLMNSLVRGQKLPLFSSGGMPHDRIAIEIAQNARLRRQGEGAFAIVFVGIGISHDSAEAFRRAMQESGALAHTAMFLNLASESSTQRLLTPRFALTAAEYLAEEEERHVLVIMTDMTNYCEALREVSASHGEVPSRKGYPGYMYSDLASIYERAGCIRGAKGTVTQLPILTMPAEDISHPIPDLTGYITEGQIVLSRDLHRKGIYPPIDVLPSLSRLMDAAIGEGKTRPDHRPLADQLYALYAQGRDLRRLVAIIGEAALSADDRLVLAFADRFETDFIGQGLVNRSIEETLDRAWDLLAPLPVEALKRIPLELIARYHRPKQ